MEFHITEEQRRLQRRKRCLAEDFATRAARHDRETSHPVENYAALRDAGFYGLNVPAALGGGGAGLLGYSLAAEELAQGCASTALAFNMHLSIVGPIMESALVPDAVKMRVARMVVDALRMPCVLAVLRERSHPHTSSRITPPRVSTASPSRRSSDPPKPRIRPLRDRRPA